MIMQVTQADSSEVSNIKEILDNVAEIGREMHLVTGLSGEGQSIGVWPSTKLKWLKILCLPDYYRKI